MSGFTPEPWFFRTPPALNGHAVTVETDNGDMICECYEDGLPNEANANLIAAAPELYAALDEMLVEKVDYMLLNSLGNPEEQHSVKRARAALAKAQGTHTGEKGRG